MKGYPRYFTRSMALALVVLAATGVVLVPNLLVFKWEMDFENYLEGGTRVKVAAAHVSAAIVCIWFIGALWPVHMRSGMRRKKNRLSGLAVNALILALVATGVASFYLGDEDWQKYNGALHLGAGMVLIVAVIAHWLIGRRMAKQKTSSAGRE